MRIMQLKYNSKGVYPVLTKAILALTAVLLSSLGLSSPFIFPNIVSMEQNTLKESFIDGDLLKSVGLRGESSFAGFVKASILTPQRDLKDNVANTLVLTKISSNGKHARYSQSFLGYEVFGGEVIAHLGRQGVNLDRVTGNFITGLEAAGIAKKATLKSDQAIDKARQLMDASYKWLFQNKKAELMIYHNPNKENFKPALAYIVSFMAMSKTANPSRPIIVIDAVTGEVIDSWEGLNTKLIQN